MIYEIIGVYKKEYSLYKQIYEVLYKLNSENFDETRFEIDIQNVDFILQQIKILNNRAEQLKEIYITKKEISDFTGSEIKKVENEDRYKELKTSVDELGDIIATVKNLQDKVMSKMNREVNVINKIIKENKSKKPVEYIKSNKNNKNPYINNEKWP